MILLWVALLWAALLRFPPPSQPLLEAGETLILLDFQPTWFLCWTLALVAGGRPSLLGVPLLRHLGDQGAAARRLGALLPLCVVSCLPPRPPCVVKLPPPWSLPRSLRLPPPLAPGA